MLEVLRMCLVKKFKVVRGIRFDRATVNKSMCDICCGKNEDGDCRYLTECYIANLYGDLFHIKHKIAYVVKNNREN